MKVQARCIARAWDSGGCRSLYPGEVYEIDLSKPYDRLLVDLKAPSGEWLLQFDRAGANDPPSSLFFCKNCGMRFDKLNEIGQHRRMLKLENGKPNPCRVEEKLIPESDTEEEATAEA